MKSNILKIKTNGLTFATKAGACVAGVLGAAVSAHAALPAAATTAFTTIQEDGLDLIDLAWPVMIAITGGFIIMRLFRRAANRSA